VCVPEQTIVSRQRKHDNITQSEEFGVPSEHMHQVPTAAIDALCRLADKSQQDSEETATEDLQAQLAATNGYQVTQDWIRHTLHDQGYSLRSARPRSRDELDEESIKASILLFWQEWEKLLENEGFDLAHLLAFDEKPLWTERFRRRIWRKLDVRVAVVKSEGKTRTKETIILPSLANGKKLPPIFIFHGTKQQRVKVPDGMPAMVIFNKSAMQSSDSLAHVLRRAVLPNLDPDNKTCILLDDHPSHFSRATREFGE